MLAEISWEPSNEGSLKTGKICMGIDQSLRCTGISIMHFEPDGTGTVLYCNSLRTASEGLTFEAEAVLAAKKLIQRLAQLSLKYKPDVIALEGVSLGSSGSSLSSLSMLLGALLLELDKLDHIQIVVVPPSTVKKFATGKGNAKKDAMYASLEQIEPELYKYLSECTAASGKFDVTDSYWIAMITGKTLYVGK